MFGLFGGQVAPLMSLQGAAGVIETVCGLLIMVGLLTKPAAFLASGEMAVAYWYIHVFMSGALLPHLNRGVDAALFCFAFLYIASKGAGVASLDSIRGAKR
jgi:putative oxidoreductase